MRLLLLMSFPLVACLTGWTAAARDVHAPGRLVLPAKGLSVALESGDITSKGISGQCLEIVSKAGSSTLVVRKSPGDDTPTVLVNGKKRPWTDSSAGRARLGSIRLARDGALVYLRTWKTGDKQIELLQDGRVVRSWPRSVSVKLLRLTGREAFLLEGDPKSGTRLMRYQRDDDGKIDPDAETVVEFGSCRPERLRMGATHAWAEMDCGEGRGKGIYRVSLETGEIGEPVLAAPAAEFLTLPKGFLPRISLHAKGDTFAVVSGTPSAMYFYQAVAGLLLSQTGEARACSSDAEGLQSWNQSYRVRALATLFAKTGDPVFAELARKSIRLTLAARDGERGRESPTNPGCGWSSLIYGGKDGERLSLMINQAMIANALRAACRDLGVDCPEASRDRIETGAMCLAKAFDDQFDPELNLYRIRKGIGFRFSGVVAPWNWQMSFAALLNDLPEQSYRQRAKDLADNFLSEWQSAEDGSLWRYWPRAYYAEKGLTDDELIGQRYEDTGHAGISLLSLREFARGRAAETVKPVQARLNHLVSFGPETPRDLDGRGPKATRWFPTGGWADYGSEEFREILSRPIPNRKSAGGVYAFSRLFEPDEAFRLTFEIFACTDDCTLAGKRSYGSWKSFLEDNPLFDLPDDGPASMRPGDLGNSDNQLNIHTP